MAAGTKGTDPTLDAQLKLMAAQTGLTVAQIQQIAEERGIKREELAQRGALATEGFKVDREKLGLGREELSQKDKQAKLAAALDALGISSKEKIAGQSERAGLQSDLTRRTDVPLDVVARTAAANGDPALFNALAAKKLQEREKLVTSMIPALQKASSDKERETKIKPALEAAFPGSYQEALARAYPKPGQAVPATTPEPAPPSTVAPTGDTTNPLAATLLAAAGFGGGATGSATSVPPGTVPSNFIGPPGSSQAFAIRSLKAAGKPYVEGNVYGAPPGMDFNTNTGEFVPSNAVGTINGRPATDVVAEGALRSGVSPEDTRSRVAYEKLLSQPQLSKNVPAPQGTGEPVAPAPFDFSALLANNTTSPVANPTPQVTPTPGAPVANDAAEAARLAELERQRQLREALALRTQNSQ